MMLAALAFDPIQMLFWLVLILVGFIICLIVYTIAANHVVPGFLTWIMSAIMGNLPVMLSSDNDGWMDYKLLRKDSGSISFNSGTNNEMLDRTVIDKMPLQTLCGHRIMVRCNASAIPNSPNGELDDIQRVLDHIDENPKLYPALKDMQEFEIFGLLGHDPQTAQELMTYRCQVPVEVVGKDGKVIKRDESEVKAEIAGKVDDIMKQAEILKNNLKYLPRHSVYVDIARCIDATQQRLSSQILKRYRAEVEAQFRAKFGGAENSLWKGLAIGGGLGLIVGSIAVMLIKGV